MSRAAFSVAMTGAVAEAARKHLLREDGQEDLCFGIRARGGAGRLRSFTD
jgi:hypothetical protein